MPNNFFLFICDRQGSRRGRDRMVVEFYNYLCNQCLSPLTLWVRIPSRRRVLVATLCDKVCQWVATCRWLSPGSPVSSTNKTDRQDITEILLKVALNTITLTSPLTVKSDTRQLKHTYVDQLDHSPRRVLGFIKSGNRRLVRWKYEPWQDLKQDVVRVWCIDRKEKGKWYNNHLILIRLDDFIVNRNHKR